MPIPIMNDLFFRRQERLEGKYPEFYQYKLSRRTRHRIVRVIDSEKIVYRPIYQPVYDEIHELIISYYKFGRVLNNIGKREKARTMLNQALELSIKLEDNVAIKNIQKEIQTLN